MNIWKNYSHWILSLIFTFLLLNLWYISGLAIEHRVIPVAYDYFINALIVVSAAFFGSFSAFYLNRVKEENQIKEKQIDSINSALFRLMRQSNTIAVEKIELEKVKDREERCFVLPASVSTIHEDVKINIPELEFLLKCTDSHILFDLSIEQERFHSAITAINLRCNLHMSKVQPALNIQHFIEKTTFEEFSEVVGPIVSIEIANHTDQVYDHVYATYESLDMIKQRLIAASNELFPGTKFLDFRTTV